MWGAMDSCGRALGVDGPLAKLQGSPSAYGVACENGAVLWVGSLGARPPSRLQPVRFWPWTQSAS